MNYLPTEVNTISTSLKGYDSLSELKGKLITLVLEGEFPYKVGNSLTYKHEKSINHGLLVDIVRDKNCAIMILSPKDPLLTFIYLPRNIEIEVRPVPPEVLSEWRNVILNNVDSNYLTNLKELPSGE